MKKVLTIALVLALVIIVGGVVLTMHSYNAVHNSVMQHLENKGYTESQLQNTETKYSIMSGILGYQTWSVQVEFADEPGIIYYYHYDKQDGVTQGGVSGGKADTQKDGLLHLE